MRDRRFIAEHRGGPLKKEQHHQLMLWSCLCAENVLPMIAENKILFNALSIGRDWVNGKTTVGDCRKASVGCHKFARESENQIEIAIARACGHAVATAHMADHSLGGAIYALKAINLSGKSIVEEKNWQNNQLNPEISEIVLEARELKEQGFKDLRI